MEIELIDTGRFVADGGAMFGAVPKTAWSRRYPSNEANGCVLAMRSMLIRTDCGRIILVDTGAGTKHLRALGYYQFFDLVDLQAELSKRGIAAEEVTDVVLTHLHFDHCGYNTERDKASGSLSVSFPQATHWVGRAQWDNCIRPNPLEKDSYFVEDSQAVVDAGLLRLIEADTDACAGVHLRLYDGHTPGQIAVYADTAERTVVFAGDVIPLAASLSPEWISAYDTYPVVSYAEKLRMLVEAAREDQALVFCHDAYTPCCTVKKVTDFYTKNRLIRL